VSGNGGPQPGDEGVERIVRARGGLLGPLVGGAVLNPVAVHLLSLLILVAGAMSYANMRREIFPDFTRERIRITTVYPGASPEDVEELLTVKIEDAIQGIDGVEGIESTSQEGISWVNARLEPGTDVTRALQDIDRAVAAVQDLPEDLDDDPLVEEIKTRFPVITLSVYGDVDELTLKDAIRPIKREMEGIPGVGSVQPSGLREVEWSIDVDPEALTTYEVSLAEVAAALGAQNLNVPGGLLEQPRDEMILRTRGQTETVEQVEAVVIRARPDGSQVRVGDVARVVPGFERARTYGRFNGKRALNLTALKSKDGDIIEIAQAVRRLARELDLPPGVRAQVHTDLSVFLESRLQTMKNNAFSGFFLVMLSLCVLLNWRMAILVALGIPLAFLVTFTGMAALGMSVNMMTLFAFILILGMLVDDAIIVTENTYRLIEEGLPPAQAAVQGTLEVARPVVATVLTTIAAFLPMLLTPGEMGQWMSVVPIVVSLCLLASLIECFGVLPCHVAEFARPQAHDPSSRFSRFLVTWEGWMRRVLRWRYPFLAGVVGASVVLVALSSVFVKFVLFGKFESDTYFLNYELPTSASLEENSTQARQLEVAVLGLPDDERAACITNVGLSAIDINRVDIGSHLGQVVFNLRPPDDRERSADEIVDDVRQQVADLPGFTKIEFKGLQAGPGGAAIEVALQGDDYQQLRKAADVVKAWLNAQPGVQDVYDDWAPGKGELEVRVDLDAAQAVGLDTASVARQVRDAFQGREATTFRRLDEDVPLMVRFPQGSRAERRTLEELWLRTPRGDEVPLDAVAHVLERRGLAKILRNDRRRSVTILGDVDIARANALEVTERLRQRFARDLPQTHAVDLEIKGQRREAEQSIQGLMQAFLISVTLIYLILGTVFRSFTQPLFVMMAIPFGIDGVLVGHMLLGKDLTFMSVMGVVACSGIVVNDSLVLVDLVNRLRAEGMELFEAAVLGSCRRLRAILLTSATTILGLGPLAFFASGQARFLSPMAISIVFGLAFATGLTLIVIPCLYLVLEDLKTGLRRMVGWNAASGTEPPEHMPAGETTL
jgi:hydrophobic/amphiphilic exporter-1 (mainly G- bacteria), HAE1 family